MSRCSLKPLKTVRTSENKLKNDEKCLKNSEKHTFLEKNAVDIPQTDISRGIFVVLKNLYFPKISSTSFLKISFPLIPLTHGIWHPLVNVYITMENHHFLWEIPLFLWPCSIANCLFTRGSDIQEDKDRLIIKIDSFRTRNHLI